MPTLFKNVSCPDYAKKQAGVQLGKSGTGAFSSLEFRGLTNDKPVFQFRNYQSIILFSMARSPFEAIR